MPRGKAIWNANGGFVSVLLTHLLLILLLLFLQSSCGNFIVVTKQEILVIPFTNFFCAASRRDSDVILIPAIRRVSGNDFAPVGQCTSTLRHAHATVELLRQETPNFFAPNYGLQAAQISVLWITRSGLSCSIVSTTDKSIV